MEKYDCMIEVSQVFRCLMQDYVVTQVNSRLLSSTVSYNLSLETWFYLIKEIDFDDCFLGFLKETGCFYKVDYISFKVVFWLIVVLYKGKAPFPASLECVWSLFAVMVGPGLILYLNTLRASVNKAEDRCLIAGDSVMCEFSL